ncbi:hypothetical protein B0H14DRAFT_3705330 [Mycena olivaceomarginata]|nr:hypothetical protein B0H14DRAFT_3705330 [Mycena olivaceomarginata]
MYNFFPDSDDFPPTFMENYMSGGSSPASSSMYGDSMLGSSEIHRPFPLNTDWMRSSSPAASLSHRSSSSYLQNLELRLQNLEKENGILHAQNNSIKEAYHELANAVPSLLALTSNPFAQEDFPLVQYWTREDFKGDTSGVSNHTGPNPRGASLVSQGVNVRMKYIENANGEAQIWFELVKKGIAPRTWGKAGLDVATLYNDEMCRKFPELRYCADNWKAQAYATANYSSWYSTHGPEKTSKKGGSTAKQPRAADSQPPPEHRKKIKLDNNNLIQLNPLWDPPVSSDPAGSAPPTAPVSEGIPIGGVPLAAPPPPTPQIPAALTGENHVDPEPVVPSAPPVVTASPAASLPVPDLVDAAAASLAVLDPVDAAAAHAALIQSAFPMVQVPPPPPVPASTPAPAPVRGPKEPKMTATNSLTARNLCAIEWIDKHHGSRPAFTAYWNSIIGTTEEQHWNNASSTAKANAKANLAMATA